VHNAFVSKRGALFFPFGTNSLWPLSLLSGLACSLVSWLGIQAQEFAAIIGIEPGLCDQLDHRLRAEVTALRHLLHRPVGPFATTTTVSTSSAKVAQGAAVTFTAKVSGQGNPTGNCQLLCEWLLLRTVKPDCGARPLSTHRWLSQAFIPSPHNTRATRTTSNSTSPGVGLNRLRAAPVMQVNAQTSTLFHSVNVTVTLQ